MTALPNNRAIVEAFLDAFLRRDGKTQFSLLHPEVEIYDPEGLPYGGRYSGLDGWRQMNRNIMATWKDLQLKMNRVIGAPDDDQFAVCGEVAGVSIKTGKTFRCDVFEHWRIRDGLIIGIRPFYWDTKLLAEINGDVVPV